MAVTTGTPARTPGSGIPAHVGAAAGTPEEDASVRVAAADAGTVVVFNNVVPRLSSPNDIAPNFDFDEADEAHTEELDDIEEVHVNCDNNGGIVVTGNGIQQRYVEGIQKRIQYECSKAFGKATGGVFKDRKWLLAHLDDHH